MEDQSDLIEMTAGIVSAYVGNNVVATADLPALIQQVHAALATVGAPAAEPAPAARRSGADRGLIRCRSGADPVPTWADPAACPGGARQQAQ